MLDRWALRDRFVDRVAKMAAEFGSDIVLPCDVSDDAQITGLFGFARLGLNQFLEAAAAVLACLGLLLLIKGIGRRLLGGNPASGGAPASESAKPLL